MKRYSLLTSMIAAPFILATAVLAADTFPKDKIIFHIREIYSIPSNVAMTVSDPVPSKVPSLQVAVLTIGDGERAQKASLYLSLDGKHYFLAEAQDLSVDPDSDRRAKIRTDGSPFLGPADAPVTIVEFSDFQCPFCKKAHESVREEMPKFGSKAKWVYKFFPLTQIHPWAESAAVAAACAMKLKPETFWGFADHFYEQQASISKENLREKIMAFAAMAKLDAGAFGTCYDTKATLDQVRKDMAEGEAVGVQSTPSFYVNGHNVRGFSDIGPLREAVEAFAAGKHP